MSSFLLSLSPSLSLVARARDDRGGGAGSGRNGLAVRERETRDVSIYFALCSLVADCQLMYNMRQSHSS